MPKPRALAAVLALTAAAVAAPARADGRHGLDPGNLLVSRTVYDARGVDLVPGTTVLPPGCVSACAVANNDATYPFVWDNDLIDPSFGITSKIFLDELTPWGGREGTIEVPAGAVTSFSSKSELALNLSTDRRHVTFMGYVAPPGAIDVSNSNTPGVLDPTNPVPGADFRVVAQLGRHGHFHFTETNAYSGNNGRAAILNDDDGVIYTAGNAGNGGTPQPPGVIIGAGAQIITPSHEPESVQQPGQPTPLGSFNIAQLGLKPDKIGKDTNFRGLTTFDHVVYYTKGSGGNGINTVYFVDTTGKACPNGVGLPQPGAALPTTPLAYDPTVVQTKGLEPTNMCILKGFPTATKSTTAFPFGIWFANSHTAYVADEGNGDNTFSTTTTTYANAAAQTTAGLQKWVFDDASGSWQLAYTLQRGLDLGQPYTVRGYPTGDNPATGLPWSPAADGLRNITGRVNRDGTATIWALTSTVSGNGDQGADPNKLVAITDRLDATTAPSMESFATIRSARYGEVLRGVTPTP
jgi:hypothetical protein